MKLTLFFISCFITLCNGMNIISPYVKCKHCKHIIHIGSNEFRCRRYIKLNNHVYRLLTEPPQEAFDYKYHPTIYDCRRNESSCGVDAKEFRPTYKI